MESLLLANIAYFGGQYCRLSYWKEGNGLFCLIDILNAFLFMIIWCWIYVTHSGKRRLLGYLEKSSYQ